MNEEKELPEGWMWTTLGETCSRPQYGWTTKANHKKGTVQLLRTTDISGGLINWSTVPYCTEIPENLAAYILYQDDLVISRAGSVGVSYLLSHIPSEAVFASYLIRFHPYECIVPRYIAYYLQTSAYWDFIYEQSSGIALANVNARKLEAVEIPLAPFPEQHRIVAAIEQQFTRLDAGVAALQRAKARLKRYRAAVLKAAVEGKLTENWRAEHPTTEPACLLLKRILEERRAKWEADLRAKGKDPAKAKYVEPAKPDVENLPELPEGWCWASLSQCSQRITDGTHLPPQFVEEGVPFIFVSHIVKGAISFENTKYISEATYLQLNTRCPVEFGDILYSAVGSYGVAVPVLTNQPFSFQRHIAHVKPSRLLQMKYLIFCLNSSFCLDQAHRDARGVAQKTVTLTDLARFVIPVAPLAEQEQITAEVERRLSIISELETTIEANLKRAERLRQSILREAFAGRLVPQDPTDEPANILLERIRNERKNGQNASNKAGNGKRVPRVPEPISLDVTETEQAALWESVER